jgi:hypothetical protein
LKVFEGVVVELFEVVAVFNEGGKMAGRTK